MKRRLVQREDAELIERLLRAAEELVLHERHSMIWTSDRKFQNLKNAVMEFRRRGVTAQDLWDGK